MLYYVKNFRIQTSAYFGGSCGLTKIQADSLQLSYGAFGTPVGVYEGNIQYNLKGVSVKALAAVIQISDAPKINRAYANNTPEQMLGYYGEIGYNVLYLFKKYADKNLTVFARYENVDMNYKIPTNGIINGTLKQQYIVGGIVFQPLRGVTVKADYVFKETGKLNPALIINPLPANQRYRTNQGFFNLGIGYSF